MNAFRCYKYTLNGITLNMFQVTDSKITDSKSYTNYYYSVFLTLTPTSKNRIARNAVDFYDKKFDQIDLSFVKDEDVCKKDLFEWSNYGSTQEEYNIYANGMLYASVEILERSLFDYGWVRRDMWEINSIESLRAFAKEDQQMSVSNTRNGCSCRSCNEFNSYASPDGVANDEKYTCWNCANSYMRVRIGLSVDLNIRSKQIQAIQTYNNIKN